MVEEKKEKTQKLGDRLEGANINSEKKRQVGDRLEDVRLDGEDVHEREENKRRISTWKIFWTALKNSGILDKAQAFFIALSSTLLAASGLAFIISKIRPELTNEIFITYSLVFGIFGLVAFSLLVLFEVGYFVIRSSIEREKQNTMSRFSDEENKIRRQIEEEKNEEKKQELEQQALELRQEYESLMSENLRRKDGTFVEDWREALLVARKRLQDEEQRLLARNVANLRNGIIMAFLGILLPALYLYYALFGNVVQGSNSIVGLTAYLPVFSVVLISEIVAIFFLNLYASNERRLERNKSDLTNIELRLTAGLMLYDKTNKDNFAILADNLSKEDSKFVLGKNESSGGDGTNKLLETLLKITPTGGG